MDNDYNQYLEDYLPYSIEDYFILRGVDKKLYLNEQRNLTIGGLKKIISEKIYIPIYRQKLLFDNNELDDTFELSKIRAYCFNLEFLDTPIESDFIDIKVKDLRKYANNQEDFNVKVDLYKNNIFDQICKFKNIPTSNSYLTYDTLFDFKYKMFADHHLGKKN